MVGSWGARATLDGIEGISNPAANLSNQPIELIEAETPLEVVRYGLVPDSGGPGRHRGGLAFVREFRLRGEEATFTLRSDRRVHRPYGIAGGMPGAPSFNLLRRAMGDEKVLPTMPMSALALRRGDSLQHIAAGGGGYGEPTERDPLAVLEDVREEKVSIEAAERDYAVVIDKAGLDIDLAATEALRRRRWENRAEAAE
jgi:N-methylhydantoinase B